MATQNFFDDVFDDLSRPSLRIPPLHIPLQGPSTTSARPPPLEPNARINIDNEANKLTGRRKALAQAKPLDAPEPNDWEAQMVAKLTGGLESQEIDPLQDRPRKKQKLYDQDFVQLPKPQTKAQEEKPRPFRPIAVLNELHEPPPSAALFPPITPNASQEEHDLTSTRRFEKDLHGERPAPARREKIVEYSTGSGTMKKTYNRARMKWTEHESEQLVKGVTIYGMGRWKSILEHPELQFQEGRTGPDLKDRFRTLFPKKFLKSTLRQGPEEADDMANSPAADSQSREKIPLRARKRHWTEAEDAELDKGFRIHGFQWNLMVKDTDLHFVGRSGGQIRDRFRLRFPELYNQQNSARAAKKPPEKFPLGKNAPPAKPASTRKKSGDADEQKTVAPSDTMGGVLNAEDEDKRLSNSILHDNWDLDDNLTLAPLAWEDIANRPIFQFD